MGIIMNKKLSKEAKLKQDWMDFNKQYRGQPKLKMTFDEYTNWVFGKTPKPKASNKAIIVGRPCWATKDNIPSLIGNSKASLGKNSMVEKVTQGKITGDTAEKIIRNSKRIGIAYNKGSYQYITDETDAKTIGKKI
jgi:hypothetical protein